MGLRLQGWKYTKDDPETNKPVVRLYADSFRVTNNPSAFELQGLALKQFNKKDASYTYIKANRAHFDQRSEIMTSDGPVSIVMNVPVGKDAENKDELAKRVQVRTSGVTYDTEHSGCRQNSASHLRVSGRQRAKRSALNTIPHTKTLHMKSQVVLDRNGMHVRNR